MVFSSQLGSPEGGFGHMADTDTLGEMAGNLGSLGLLSL